MKKDISPCDYKEYPYIEEYISSSLPPPNNHEKVEEDFEEEKMQLSLPLPFDKLEKNKITEAEDICKKKKLRLVEQAAALSILYAGKIISSPLNLLLKTLRSGGVSGADEIIKTEQERKAKEREKQEKDREQEDEKIEKEKADKEYYKEAENRLNNLSDEEIKK
ncbi:MAG: hypothetical protein HY279_02620 [Nitrospinae bacterium]|nr:hypothetical protein [Nitrospinota bacterium]